MRVITVHYCGKVTEVSKKCPGYLSRSESGPFVVAAPNCVCTGRLHRRNVSHDYRRKSQDHCTRRV